MKKVSLVAMLVALTSTSIATANVPANCPKAFQGFHLGGNVGVGFGTVQQNFAVSDRNNATGAVTNIANSTNRLGVRGFDGGVNTGYTHRFGNFGLGLEFVANWTDSKGSLTTRDFSPVPNVATAASSAKLKNSLQLRGNFSYVIANLVAPKFIIGWDSSKWAQQTTLTNFGTVNAAGQQVPFAVSSSKYHNAFLIGLGVDFLATKHFILGMDATISMFDRKAYTRSFANPAAVLNTTHTQVNSIKPTYSKISLVAKFIY